MDELEYAVDTIRGTPFEKLAGEVLRESGDALWVVVDSLEIGVAENSE
jgi:hypothetical protein